MRRAHRAPVEGSMSPLVGREVEHKWAHTKGTVTFVVWGSWRDDGNSIEGVMLLVLADDGDLFEWPAEYCKVLPQQARP